MRGLDWAKDPLEDASPRRPRELRSRPLDPTCRVCPIAREPPGRFDSFVVRKGHESARWHLLVTPQAHSTDGLRPVSSPPGSDLLTAEEVAALLRVTRAWVYAQTRRHRIPHLRLGRYVRYRREALEAWMAQVESSSSSPVESRGRRDLAALP
jgi:excisionase family DNA binding protein